MALFITHDGLTFFCFSSHLIFCSNSSMMISILIFCPFLLGWFSEGWSKDVLHLAVGVFDDRVDLLGVWRDFDFYFHFHPLPLLEAYHNHGLDKHQNTTNFSANLSPVIWGWGKGTRKEGKPLWSLLCGSSVSNDYHF